MVLAGINAFHFLLFQQGTSAFIKIPFVGAGRRGHRRIAVAQVLIVRIGVIAQPGHVAGIIERNAALGFAVPTDLP
ncbi:hypothetical protein D3C71_1697980 [compost metagenome]